jgi:hypothetical protein
MRISIATGSPVVRGIAYFEPLNFSVLSVHSTHHFWLSVQIGMPKLQV